MINRKKYKQWISKNDMHTWSCPTCHESILEYEDKNFNCVEDSDYHQYSSEPSYQVPNDINFRYTLVLKCINPSCQESVVNVGQYSIERIQEYDEYREIIDVENYWFSPKYFYPPLHLFQIPKGTPEEVRENIIKSFSTFFSDYESSANSLRVALECIINKLNENPELSKLHKKIEKLATPKYDNIRDKCMALKWLGNDGSHCGNKKMTSNDILDGYDLLSFVLEELYIEESSHVDMITKRLNENEGI